MHVETETIVRIDDLNDLPTNHRPRTLADLIQAYNAYATRRYRNSATGKPTGEAANIRAALRPLLHLSIHGDGDAVRRLASIDPATFSPTDLRAFQHARKQRRTCYRQINKEVNCIRRMFRWAVARELIADDVYHRLRSVEPIRRGDPDAQDRPRIKPVEWSLVDATVQACRRKGRDDAADMMLVHWHTGMRPGELVSMCESEIDATGDVWIYRPGTHKTSHHGIERIIPIGPRAQTVLRPWLTGQHALPFGADYFWRITTSEMYRDFIRNTTRDAKLQPWWPNQIRHAAATRLRREVGLEAARVVLGHTSASTTEIYAETDRESAIALMSKHG